MRRVCACGTCRRVENNDIRVLNVLVKVKRSVTLLHVINFFEDIPERVTI